ncbi:MAG TPA: protein kinase [Vicinamibacterales bacterium]|nr:protein kinase [Vicinamibacterales bacterium]
MIGTSHGPYEVTNKLGEGGMGEVYLARDTKLGRSVALKVISEAVARDPERIARFEREARALAALNHPSIAAIYGLEEHEGRQAIVMELVEGPTLADRLIRGPLSVAEAMKIARQIASAVEAAHKAGIIHRDLKPANIKVRPDGTVKVLDFGLARALDPSRPREAESGGRHVTPETKTVMSPAVTEVGVILGTAAYMSPEQARGELADEQSDVWSFGCVCYEMLTGRRAFKASTVAETMAAVLRADVDWTALPVGLSPLVREFLVRCLARDPAERLHAIGDMRLAIEGAFDRAVAPAAGARSGGRRVAAALLGSALLVAVAATAFVWGAARPSGSTVVSRLQMLVPPGQHFYFNGRHLVAVSPDATMVAYTAGLGLWLHRLDDLEGRPVPGAELEARSPFFSHDGQSIGYYAAGELRRVPANGGAPVTIGRAVNPWGASWTADDVIYYGQGPDGIWRLPASGGTGERVIEVQPGEQAQSPHLLPDGDSLLFTLLPARIGSWNRAQIVVQSISSGDRTVLVSGARDARYLSTGHLVYAVNGVLFAASLDVSSRQLGPAVAVARDISDGGNVTGGVHYDIAASGALVYVPRTSVALRLTWVDPNGVETAIPAEPRPYRHPRVSPDGSRIAVEVEDAGNTDIWVGDQRRGTFSRLTIEDDVDSDPIWSADGSRIVFSSVRGAAGLFWMSADGTGSADLLTNATGGVRAFGWTSDGRLLFEELQGPDVRLLSPGSGAAPELKPLFDSPDYFNEVLPALSPDGRWLAYQSTESGQMAIYVRPFPDVSAGRWEVSEGSGFAPLWSHDGRQIFYRSPTSLMAVSIRTSPTFGTSTPRPLFSLADYVLAGTRGIRYDVAPDGRFLMLKDDTGVSAAQSRVIVVQNWFTELERLTAGR